MIDEKFKTKLLKELEKDKGSNFNDDNLKNNKDYFMNPNPNPKRELPKFKKYDTLYQYLLQLGYGNVLQAIFNLEFERMKSKDKVEDLILKWWNYEEDIKLDLRLMKPSGFLLFSLKKELKTKEDIDLEPKIIEIEDDSQDSIPESELITEDIKYEELFEMTPETPIAVKYTKKDKEELTKRLGTSWYFVSSNTIKYFDDKTGTWKYISFTPREIIRKKDLDNNPINNPNSNNPNSNNSELPKFEDYDDLFFYLANLGYASVLQDIFDLEFKRRLEGWKKRDVEKKILGWWNEELQKPDLRAFRTSYFLMWHLKEELKSRKIITKNNPDNLNKNSNNNDNNEKFGIVDLMIEERWEGGILLEELKKKLPKEKYKKFKEYFEQELGYDLDEYMENEPMLFTYEGLKDEYYEILKESGIPENVLDYVDVEAMISDDKLSGYLRTIEIDGMEFWARIY